MVYTSFYFIITALLLRPLWYLFIPIGLSALSLIFRQKICESSNLTKFLANIPIPTGFAITGYISVGDIDQLSHVLARKDHWAIAFDNFFFDRPIALIIEETLNPFPLMSVVFYDVLIINYFLYFVTPFIGGILLYRQFSREFKHNVGQFIFSICLFYITNYLLYLLVPITGPQYFQKEYFNSALPFSFFGEFLYSIIQRYHYTLIDCFPSGHFGISFLVSLFLYRWNNIYYIVFGFISFFIFWATLALRYHYLYDLVFSVVLVYVVYKLSEFLYPLRSEMTLFRKN